MTILTRSELDAFVPFPRTAIEGTIVARFEEQVERHPDLLAVAGGRQALTYAELNRRANRLAREIVSLRGTDQEPIALLLEKDGPAIVAMVAVLKANKIYVPLDPTDPPARLAALAADSQPTLLIADRRNLGLAAEIVGSSCPIVDVAVADEEGPADNLGLSGSPEALINIMYTSGSTGQPKGVPQTHRNLLHAVYSRTNRLHVSPADRLALIGSYSFGASAADVFGAILTGAAICLYDLKREGMAGLPAWLVRERITICHSVPTIFRNLLRLLGPEGRLDDLRAVGLGGEPVFGAEVARFRERVGPSCEFHLTLGTTETYRATSYVIDRSTPIEDGVLPCGYPDEDKEILLLRDGEPCPPGEVGEIGVRSRYLSPGYWRRPDLTASSFLPDPDGGDRRIYRTGDLGRLRPDGCLDHLGRGDQQIKIRGHLVAPVEVERLIRAIPGVRDAAVVADGEIDDKRLIGYVVVAEAGPTVEEVRQALAARLPAATVPSRLLFLDELPRLPTGKIDARSLPAASTDRPALANAYLPPRTPLESQLAGIWGEMLRIDGVGVEDQFLDLGGDSLLAARIVARTGAEVGVELDPAALFEAPTVAGLARLVTQRLSARVDEADLDQMLAELEAMSESAALARLTEG